MESEAPTSHSQAQTVALRAITAAEVGVLFPWFLFVVDRERSAVRRFFAVVQVTVLNVFQLWVTA